MAQESYVSLDQAYESKFMREFVKVASESKDLGDFLGRLGTVRSDDVIFLQRHFNPRRPLPKITYKDSTITFDDQSSVKIVDLKSHSFRINGRNFKYDSQKSMVENWTVIDKQLRPKKSAKFLWPLGFLNNLLAAAKKEEAEEPEEDINKTDLFYKSNERFWKDPTSAGDNASWGWALISPVMAADWLTVKADAALSPSCDKQVEELNSLLEESKLGLKTSFCGSTYRGFDRKMTFWTSAGKGKAAQEKTYDLDFRTQTMREANSDRMLFFGKDSLDDVRDLKKDAKGHLECVDVPPDSGDFQKTKKSIEPLRKILFYIGNNRTCEKCSNELRSKVATTKPPAYLSNGSSPASDLSGATMRTGTK